MDEPNEKQDNSSAEQEATSETTETFTKEDRDKAVSDALSKAGRTATALEKREAAVKLSEEADAQRRMRAREQELEDHRDDKQELSAISEKHKRQDAESELARKEQELEKEKAKTMEVQEKEAESTKERNAREIATRLEVDAKTLIKFTDGSTEAMEELAKQLSRGETKDPLKLVSSKTIGGKNWRDLSADDKIRRGLKK